MYTGHHWLYLNIAEQDLNSFAPAWAAYRGILATPSMILPPNIRATHLGLTPHIIRLTRKRNAISLEKELALEVIRRKKYPNAVSRLNCIYCWPDAGAAQLAARLWIPQGKHFSEKYLVEIDVSAPRAPTIVDTRWIDRFVILSNEPLEALGTQWIYEYWRGAHYPWKGEADISREPHMECLVDGIALISGTELRMEALSVVEKLAPDSLAILEKGRLGVDLSTRPDGSEEWRFGQLAPVLSRATDNSLWVRNLICMDENLVEKINTQASIKIPADQINWRLLKLLERETMSLPDLRAMDVNFSWVFGHPSLWQHLNSVLMAFFIEAGGRLVTAPQVVNATLANFPSWRIADHGQVVIE